jgi:hypothetical protein
MGISSSACKTVGKQNERWRRTSVPVQALPVLCCSVKAQCFKRAGMFLVRKKNVESCGEATFTIHLESAVQRASII